MAYLAKDDPQVLLARYKYGDDSESKVLDDLISWIENEWDSGYDGEIEQTYIDDIVDVINKYGNRNAKTMNIIRKEEQNQLKKWTKSVLGE